MTGHAPAPPHPGTSYLAFNSTVVGVHAATCQVLLLYTHKAADIHPKHSKQPQGAHRATANVGTRCRQHCVRPDTGTHEHVSACAAPLWWAALSLHEAPAAAAAAPGTAAGVLYGCTAKAHRRVSCLAGCQHMQRCTPAVWVEAPKGTVTQLTT
jgi:hypothetical protein